MQAAVSRGSLGQALCRGCAQFEDCLHQRGTVHWLVGGGFRLASRPTPLSPPSSPLRRMWHLREEMSFRGHRHHQPPGQPRISHDSSLWWEASIPPLTTISSPPTHHHHHHHHQLITIIPGPNSFKLHRLPMPRPGQVLGLVGTNGGRSRGGGGVGGDRDQAPPPDPGCCSHGHLSQLNNNPGIGKSTALKILAGQSGSTSPPHSSTSTHTSTTPRGSSRPTALCLLLSSYCIFSTITPHLPPPPFSGKLKPNLGRFESPPDWNEILVYFRGSELQNYFTRILEDNLKCIIKPQVSGGGLMCVWGG